MGRVVIVAYRPREGKEAQLLELVKGHVPILRGEGLVTDRPPYVLRAEDGTIVEVFEWKSAEAIEQAHHNEIVLAMWEQFNEACEIETLASLKECQRPFSAFEPLDL
ncbi:MAG TPA: hypothetical protein VFD58_27770 [Blastocatellia bacterium]|nr:hypothetical protein [Blastocatellia bacterium]